VSNGTSVTIIGNLTRDPEERVTKSGQTKVELGLAATRSWKNRNEEWQEETSYFDVVAWSDIAKNSAISLKKGTRVIVVGTLKQESWNDRNTGDKRTKIVVQAEDIGPSLKRAYVQEIVKSGGQNGGGQSAHTGASNRQQPTQQFFEDEEEPF
jgi:single-strand DNA-binding protein